MPRKFTRKPTFRKKAPVGRRTQAIRKLAGQAPVTWAERISQGAGTVGRLATTVAQLQGLINSEVKFTDVGAISQPVLNSGAYAQQLTDIAEGDDVNMRNGRWILSKVLSGRVRVDLPSTATAFAQIGYAIIMDKDASVGLGATPWLDVFTAANPLAPISKVDSDRFIILKRGTINLAPGSTQARDFKVWIPLKGIHLKFDGTTSSDRDQNQIFIVAVSTSALGGSNIPNISSQFRYEYYDN